MHAIMTSSVPLADNAIVRPVLESLRLSLVWRFAISIGLAVPLAISAGIVYSFPFAGPCYRFKRYFTDLVAGRWDLRCTLRKKDELADIADAINAAMDSVRSFLDMNRKTVAEVDGLLARGAICPSSGSEESVRSLRERVAAVLASYERRFPAAVERPSTITAAGSGRDAAEESERRLEASFQK